MTEHAPLIIATLAAVIALLYYGMLRPYLEARRTAADTVAEKSVVDMMLAILDDAVGVAVLATEQTMPKLPATYGEDNLPTTVEAKVSRATERLANAIRIVNESVDIGEVERALGVKINLTSRIEAAVNQMKRGKL